MIWVEGNDEEIFHDFVWIMTFTWELPPNTLICMWWTPSWSQKWVTPSGKPSPVYSTCPLLSGIPSLENFAHQMVILCPSSKLLEGMDTLWLTSGSLTPWQMNSVFWAFSFLMYKMRKIEMALLLWGLSDQHKPTNPVSSSVGAFGTTTMKVADRIKFSKSINISPPTRLQQHYVERQMPQLSQSSW